MSDDGNEVVPATRRGRRFGESGSRQAILEAARARFAKDGYAATTIRKIAADSGFDAALVMQFFRSKEELFAAVMSISSSTLSRIANAFDGPMHMLGERITRAFLDLWEGPPQDSEPLLAMLRAAISNEHASAQLRAFFQSRLLDVIGPKLGNDPDATTRAGFASAMLVGVIVGRRIVQVPALAKEDQASVVRLVGPSIQAILTGKNS
jgi:AcrR family transcriptional regulator